MYVRSKLVTSPRAGDHVVETFSTQLIGGPLRADAALSHELHISRPEVAHPAREIQLPCAPHHEVAETNALHPAADQRAYALCVWPVVAHPRLLFLAVV